MIETLLPETTSAITAVNDGRKSPNKTDEDPAPQSPEASSDASSESSDDSSESDEEVVNKGDTKAPTVIPPAVLKDFATTSIEVPHISDSRGDNVF